MQFTKGLTVRLKIWSNLLQDQKDTGDGGGAGGGSGSILTAFNAGGGTETSKGGAGTPNDTTGKNATPGVTGEGTSPAKSTVNDWRLGLPSDLQEDATLRKFSDVPALAAAYINAQKLIGTDKIAIPGKHASDEDWGNVFKKLGLPEKVENYDLKFKEGATIDETFTNDFKSTAHKLGILPKQAQALADWFSDVNLTAETKYLDEVKVTQGKALEGLKTEWGKVYDANLSRAHLVLKNFADKDLLQHLNDTGMGNDPKLIKLLAGVGKKMYGEGQIVQGDSSFSAPMSAAEAKKTVDNIMANQNHPYFLKEHPGHKTAVKEVQDLFQKMFQE